MKLQYFFEQFLFDVLCFKEKNGTKLSLLACYPFISIWIYVLVPILCFFHAFLESIHQEAISHKLFSNKSGHIATGQVLAQWLKDVGHELKRIGWYCLMTDKCWGESAIHVIMISLMSVVVCYIYYLAIHGHFFTVLNSGCFTKCILLIWTYITSWFIWCI